MRTKTAKLYILTIIFISTTIFLTYSSTNLQLSLYKNITGSDIIELWNNYDKFASIEEGLKYYQGQRGVLQIENMFSTPSDMYNSSGYNLYEIDKYEPSIIDGELKLKELLFKQMYEELLEEKANGTKLDYEARYKVTKLDNGNILKTPCSVPNTNCKNDNNTYIIEKSRESAAFLTIIDYDNANIQNFIKTIKIVEDRFNSKFHYNWIILSPFELSYEFKLKISKYCSGNVEFGLIPAKEWTIPKWINQTNKEFFKKKKK